MSTEMTAGVVVTGSGSAVDRAADVLAGHDVSHPDLHSGLGVAIICQCGARVAQTEDASWPVAHRAHVAEALRRAGLLRDAPAMTREQMAAALAERGVDVDRGDDGLRERIEALCNEAERVKADPTIIAVGWQSEATPPMVKVVDVRAALAEHRTDDTEEYGRDEVREEVTGALLAIPWHENGQPLRPDEADDLSEAVIARLVLIGLLAPPHEDGAR